VKHLQASKTTSSDYRNTGALELSQSVENGVNCLRALPNTRSKLGELEAQNLRYLEVLQCSPPTVIGTSSKP
jgi:hypothetical protein